MGVHSRVLDCLAALAVMVALLLAAPAAAQTFPQLSGRVVDQANLLSPEQELDLSSKSEALEAQSKRQFVVATVNSLEGLEIEDYGTRLGRHWGIGREAEDDGVILLVAPNEKKVRIETGYGAEGFLPDILAGRIIRDTILPRFREGDMAGGIMAGADAILEQIALPPEEAQARARQIEAEEVHRASEPDGFALFPAVFIMIIFFVLIRSMSRGVRGRRYRRRGDDGISPLVILWGLDALSQSRGRRGSWGGGGGGWGGSGFGGGGGFGGFSGGGGGFGGGGASGGW